MNEYCCPRCHGELAWEENIIDASYHFSHPANPDETPGPGLRCADCDLEIVNTGLNYEIAA